MEGDETTMEGEAGSFVELENGVYELDCYPYTFSPLLLFAGSEYFDKVKPSHTIRLPVILVILPLAPSTRRCALRFSGFGGRQGHSFLT